jgi:hypothetical protein
MTSRLVTGPLPAVKNPMRADASINTERLEEKYIEEAHAAREAEDIAMTAIRRCIASMSLPQSIEPMVDARPPRNAASATSRTEPPSCKMYRGIMVAIPLVLALSGTRYHDQLWLFAWKDWSKVVATGLSTGTCARIVYKKTMKLISEACMYFAKSKIFI